MDGGDRDPARRTPMTSSARGVTAPPLPIVVRLARPEDRDAVLAFASGTFEGWDYIPGIWPHWLSAADGVLLVALPQPPSRTGPPLLDADGRPLDPAVPVAISRVAMLSADEGWVEGIRVDPRVRGRSVATQLQVAELAWAAAHGARVVRYVTGHRNVASVRLGARHGFQPLVDWRAYRRPREDEEDDDAWMDEPDPMRTRTGDEREDRRRADGYRRIGEAGLGLAGASDGTVECWWRRVEDDPTFRAGHALYEHRAWSFQELTRERFGRHVRGGQVAVLEGDDDRWALALLPRHIAPSEDRRVRVSVLCGDGALCLELLRRVETILGHSVQLRLPDPDPPVLRGLVTSYADAGWPAAEGYLRLLARPMGPGQPLPDTDAPGLLRYLDAPRPTAVPLGIPEA
jgi:GNAT superfamily N-acetyltransferase